MRQGRMDSANLRRTQSRGARFRIVFDVSEVTRPGCTDSFQALLKILCVAWRRSEPRMLEPDRRRQIQALNPLANIEPLQPKHSLVAEWGLRAVGDEHDRDAVRTAGQQISTKRPILIF